MKILRIALYTLFLLGALFLVLTLFSGSLFAPWHLVATAVIFAAFAFFADVLYTSLAERESPVHAAEQIGEHLFADIERDSSAAVAEFRGLESGVLTELHNLEEDGKVAAGTVLRVVEKAFGVSATPAPSPTPAATATAPAVPAASAAASVASPAPAVTAPAASPASSSATTPASLTVNGTPDQLAAIANALQSSGVTGVNIIHST